MNETNVVIIGAGPVGCIAAYYLATNGVNVVLAEAGPDCAQDLRASTFHPPTLEMLDTLGLAQPLIEKGLKAPIYHWRERETGEVFEFDLTEIADATEFPFRVQCEQFHLARMLAAKLEDIEHAEVLFSHRMLGYVENEDGLEISLETPYSIRKITADYLIGADGANSIVRKLLGVEFDGFTYPEKFLCFTTEEPLSDRKKEAVFGGLIGKPEVTTQHRTIYRVHQRVAKFFRQGRVCIIGDAAHLNNPLGGFGMNSGIHDAFNLCPKLVSIIKDGGDEEALLSQFNEERQRQTHDFVQAQTKQNMAFMR